MDTQILTTDDPTALPRALEALATGAILAFPTDTVYGVGADPWIVPAVEQLYAAKGRGYDKPIPLLVAGPDHLWRVVPGLPPLAQALSTAFWPGALTLVVPCRPTLPARVTGGGATVALRMPDHPWTLKLLKAAGGALAVTSANQSGHPDPITAADVQRELGGRLPVIIDGGPCPGGVASTIVDVSGPTPRVLREGAIPAALIEAAIQMIQREERDE
jgi:L-threonylcarbamoyladenylate synthase